MESIDDRRAHTRKPTMYLRAIVRQDTSKTIVEELTTASLRQFYQSQHSIIAGNRLKSNIAMPPFLRTLFLVIRVQEPILVDLLRLLRADDADLIVFAA